MRTVAIYTIFITTAPTEKVNARTSIWGFSDWEILSDTLLNTAQMALKNHIHIKQLTSHPASTWDTWQTQGEVGLNFTSSGNTFMWKKKIVEASAHRNGSCWTHAHSFGLTEELSLVQCQQGLWQLLQLQCTQPTLGLQSSASLNPTWNQQIPYQSNQTHKSWTTRITHSPLGGCRHHRCMITHECTAWN